MGNDIDLYINSVYCGFRSIDCIEEYFSDYSRKARKVAETLDWDEIVLYAVYSYDGERQTIISADFMLLRMSYDTYSDLVSKLSNDCRLFFVRNS